MKRVPNDAEILRIAAARQAAVRATHEMTGWFRTALGPARRAAAGEGPPAPGAARVDSPSTPAGPTPKGSDRER